MIIDTFKVLQSSGISADLKSRGAALVLVLVSLLSLSVVVLHVTETTTRSHEGAARLTLEYRAGILAEEGLDMGINMLQEIRNNRADLPAHLWRAAWKDQGLQILIIPCVSRLPINAMVTESNNREDFRKAVFELFAAGDFSLEKMEHLLYWMGDMEISGHGATTAALVHDYSSRNLEYSAPGRKLQKPEEILMIPGFEDLNPEWIRQNFTVWGEQDRIDINSADREIVLALIPELTPYWSGIESLRREKRITHPNQLLTATDMDMSTYTHALNYIVIDPEYYEILVQVELGGWIEKHRYIVQAVDSQHETSARVLAKDVLKSGAI
ncbi:type II secretion system protein GspK [Desulfonatronospira sp.]|uniref:type II secretion system protein GspK n=1 Tax=Desulfonatronospira sp. TaxID=1962951 RepID=UPI0025C1BFBE|nr:type II secretion system protein GspK [Desulfonatronospira sp.]